MKTIETPEILNKRTISQSLSDAITEADYKFLTLNILGVVLVLIIAITLGHNSIVTPLEAGLLFLSSIPISIILFQYFSVQYKKELLDENNISIQNKEIRSDVWITMIGSSIFIAVLVAINSKMDMSTLYIWAVVYPIYSLLPKLSRYFFIKQATRGE